MEWAEGVLMFPAPPLKVPWATEWAPMVEVAPAPGVKCPRWMVWVVVGGMQVEVAAWQVPPQVSGSPQVLPLQTGVQPGTTGGGTELGSMVSEQPARPSSRAESEAMRRI
jgi:hypothetical protein